MRELRVNNAKAEAEWQELPSPKSEKGEIQIQVETAGFNQADLLQIMGLYPGQVDNPVLGLEFSRIIDQVGEGIDEAWVGRRVCALLRGARIVDYVVCSPSVIVSAPNGIGLSLAAGLCETWCAALFNLWDQAKLISRERVLIDTGASGVGIAAIRLARLLGTTPFINWDSEKKLHYCSDRGVAVEVLRTQDWTAYFRGLGLQFDVILDPVDASYLNQDLSVAANAAKIALIESLGGIQTECNLLELVAKNITLFRRALRTQQDSVKLRLFAEQETIVWPAVARHKVHHGVEHIVMSDEVLDAYQGTQQGDQFDRTSS